MATGRTLSRWTRFYMNGYDLSGDARSVGPLTHDHELEEMEALNWSIKGAYPGYAVIGIGAINAILNMDGSIQIHDLFATPGSNYAVMIPIGIQAEPAQGDPVFLAQINELTYTLDVAINSIAINIATGSKPTTTSLNHKKPWGNLLRAKAATTAVNSAVGIDDNGAASAYGGFLMYQVFAGNGTATIKVQDAAVNADGSFADLSGATSGSISCATPSAAIVQLGTTATVRQFLRWQIVLGTATTVTFALAFVRSLAHNV